MFGRGGDQLADQDGFHLGTGVHRQALPPADGLGHILGGVGAFDLHQDRVDIGTAGLGSDHRIEHAGGPRVVEDRVFRRAAALLPDGIVVFEKLGLLRIL